jgi:hypothetical protein
VVQFPSPSSSYVQQRPKSVPIDMVASLMRFIRIGKAFHVSHVKIGLPVLVIWLVVDSYINIDERFFIYLADPKDGCVLKADNTFRFLVKS